MIPRRVCEVHYKPGDVVIGGLFPVYDAGSSSCIGDYWVDIVSMVESLTYAVDLVNNRTDILPNLTIGYEIRPNCGMEDLTLWSMITMTGTSGDVEYENACRSYNYSRGNRGQVIGVIGPSRSANSLLAARFGGVFHVPVISYFSTTDELSNSERFPYFLRTVPSDKFQAGAIADLLLYFNWKYVALFYSIDTYGVHGARNIQHFAEDSGICIPINMPVTNMPSEAEIADIADRLRQNDKVNVIVIFSLHYPALAVLRAVLEYEINRKFTFVGSDGWGDEAIFKTDEQFAKLLLGAIFVRLYDVPDADFHEYYKRLPLMSADHASEWYRGSLRQMARQNNCNDSDDCPIPKPYFERQPINGVLVFAHALDSIIRKECLDIASMCEGIHDGPTLLKHMLNVSFPTPDGDVFRFDENGDTSGKYIYKNFQRSNHIGGSYGMIDIGNWDSNKGDHLDIQETRLQWALTGTETPMSLCVEDCGPGFISVPLKKKCCWGCQQCPSHSIVVNDTRCSDCSEANWPNRNFSRCEPIVPTHLRLSHPVVLCTLIAALVAMICSGSVAFGLWYQRSHILLKSSSIELCYVNICGLTVACIVACLVDLYPTPSTCVISEVLISTSVCLIYTPILLKVNRIWRIFKARSGRALRFTSPKGQLVIVGVIVTTQVRIFRWYK